MKIGYIISFLVGGAVGTSLTFYISKKYFEKKKEVELNAYKEFYEGKLEKVEACDTAPDEEPTESYSSTDHDVIEPTDITEEAEAIRDAAKYLEKSAIEEENKINKKRNKKKEKVKPYLITPEAYNGDDEMQFRHDYQHLTLDYYEGDDILCESSTNEVFGNTGRWLGYTWKNHFGDEDYGYDDNSIFIRNDEIHVDYEIVRDEGYYSEQVLGIIPDFSDIDEEEE